MYMYKVPFKVSFSEHCSSVTKTFLIVNWFDFDIQEAQSHRPLSSLCFSGRSENQHGCPDL